MGQLRGQFSKFREGPPSPIHAPSPLIMEFLLSRLATGTILEVGGGNGAYSLALGKVGRPSVVSDINDSYLKVARAEGLQTLRLDPDSPLEAGQWDNVILIEVFEHVPDPSKLLAEACRAARKRVIFTIPRSEDFDALFAQRLSYNHMVVEDHLWHFGEAEIAALVEPWRNRVEIRRDEPIHPHCTWNFIRSSFRSSFLCELCLLPLRVANRFGWMMPLYDSRFLVSINLEL